MAFLNDRASFRGVPFFVESVSLNAGRRLARHEYPQRDVPYMEDMGKLAREFSVEGFVIGWNCQDQRDSLIKAIEAQGAGTLILPQYGEINAIPSTECAFTDASSEGRIVRFSLTFMEAGEDSFPSMRIDSGAFLSKSLANLSAAIRMSFLAGFRIANVDDWVIDDATNVVMTVLNAAGVTDAMMAEWSLGENRRLAVLQNPAFAVLNESALCDALLELVNTTTDLSGLCSFDVPRFVEETTDKEFIQANTNRQALKHLIVTAAESRCIAELSLRPGISRDVDGGIPTRQVVFGASDDLVATVKDYERARIQISDASDNILMDYDDIEESKSVTDAVSELVSAAVEKIDSESPEAPTVSTIVIKNELPAIVLASREYGDSWLENERDIELCQRNGVTDPNRLPGGDPITVVRYE